MPPLGRLCHLPLAMLRRVSARRERSTSRERCLEREQSDEDEMKPPDWQALERRRVMALKRAMLIGNLGADPELRHLPSGQAFTGFSVATDESFTDKRGRSRNGWNGITSSPSGIWRKAAASISGRGARSMSKDGSVRESST